MMFPLVRDLAAEGIPVRLTCGTFGFSAQAFYKWQIRPCSDRDWADAHVTNLIVDAHRDDPTFGYRFIADELAAVGHDVNERRVWRLCRDQRIWSTTTKKGRKGSGKMAGPAVHDDLVQRDFSAPAPNVVWRTDITEHPTGEGKLYVCSIKDVFSKAHRRLRDGRADDRAARRRRVALSDRTPSTQRHRDRPQRQGVAISSPVIPSRARRRGHERVDGPRRRSW
jgi:transposase InsO family protein